MDIFQYIIPSSFLASYVKHYWILEGSFKEGMTERIVPTGNMQLCFYKGTHRLATPTDSEGKILPPSLLSGQTTGYSDIYPAGAIRIICVVFQPHGANAFFRLPMQDLSNQKVSAGELSDPLLSILEEKVMMTESVTECIRHIETFLISRLTVSRDQQRIFAAIRLINQRPTDIRLNDLSNETCLSDKQFRRLFASHVGINPKDFIRTVRFQYALSIAQNHPGISLAQLAADAGFYDQPHLINEFRQFSGLTPKEYFKQCDPLSDYFS